MIVNTLYAHVYMLLKRGKSINCEWTKKHIISSHGEFFIVKVAVFADT